MQMALHAMPCGGPVAATKVLPESSWQLRKILKSFEPPGETFVVFAGRLPSKQPVAVVEVAARSSEDESYTPQIRFNWGRERCCVRVPVAVHRRFARASDSRARKKLAAMVRARANSPCQARCNECYTRDHARIPRRYEKLRARDPWQELQSGVKHHFE
jgi:hypothetical protein